MKNKVYTLFACVAIAVTLISNARGPVAAQQKGYTGAPGDQAGTCATCHNSGTFAPTATLQLFDSLGTTAATRYALGREYVIRLTITAASGTPTAYGFQMIDIRTRDSSNVKGFLPKDKQAADIGVDTIAATGRVYAGHNARLTSNVINVRWKAPATDLGVVRFYAVGNATNAGGSSAGDNGTPSVSITFNSPTSATNELAENVNIQLSPNPTPNTVFINLNSKISKTLNLRVSDISGRTVTTEQWAINVGDNTKSLDLQHLAKGAYMIQVLDNQNIVSKKVLKL
jgi:hypothetical protein